MERLFIEDVKANMMETVLELLSVIGEHTVENVKHSVQGFSAQDRALPLRAITIDCPWWNVSSGE